MNPTLLPGIYDSEKIETTEANGTPVNEIVQAGTFTFTRDGRLSVVSASNLMVMAYVGSYRIEDDVLRIKIDSCVHREMEGTEITRKILRLDGTHLVLEAIGAKSRQRTVLTWKRKLSL